MSTMETQTIRILRHLKDKGSITPLEALKKYGCYRLGARIWDLRKGGYSIRTEIVNYMDKDGAQRRYAKYSMEKAERDRIGKNADQSNREASI